MFVALLWLLEVIPLLIEVFNCCCVAVAPMTEVVLSEIVKLIVAGSSDGARDVRLVVLLPTIVVVSVIEALPVYGGTFVVLSITVENELEAVSPSTIVVVPVLETVFVYGGVSTTAVVLSTMLVNGSKLAPVVAVVGTPTDTKVVSVIAVEVTPSEEKAVSVVAVVAIPSEEKAVSVVAVVATPSEEKAVSGKYEISCVTSVKQSASVSHNRLNKYLPTATVLVGLYLGIARITAASAETISSTSRKRSAGTTAVSEGAIWIS